MASGGVTRDYVRRPQGQPDLVRCVYNCVPGSIAKRMPEGFYKCLNCKRIWQRGFNTYRILDNRSVT